MKAKNKSERINSFLKFLLLFLFTTVVILAAFYFDFNRVPIEENKILRSDLNSIKKEMTFQEEFSDDIKSIRSLIDSLDIPGQNKSFVNSLITQGTAKLQGKIPIKDSTYRYDMYANMVWSLNEIQKLKKQLESYSNAEEAISKYKEALEKCKDDLEDTKRTLDIYRNTSR